MDTLRYYLIPVVTACGLIGFYYGGYWVWLGAATFPALMVLDVILPKDFSARKVSPFFADLTQYLQLPLMIGLYGLLVFGVKTGVSNLVSRYKWQGAFFLWLGLVVCQLFRFRMS